MTWFIQGSPDYLNWFFVRKLFVVFSIQSKDSPNWICLSLLIVYLLRSKCITSWHKVEGWKECRAVDKYTLCHSRPISSCILIASGRHTDFVIVNVCGMVNVKWEANMFIITNLFMISLFLLHSPDYPNFWSSRSFMGWVIVRINEVLLYYN